MDPQENYLDEANSVTQILHAPTHRDERAE